MVFQIREEGSNHTNYSKSPAPFKSFSLLVIPAQNV